MPIVFAKRLAAGADVAEVRVHVAVPLRCTLVTPDLSGLLAGLPVLNALLLQSLLAACFAIGALAVQATCFTLLPACFALGLVLAFLATCLALLPAGFAIGLVLTLLPARFAFLATRLAFSLIATFLATFLAVKPLLPARLSLGLGQTVGAALIPLAFNAALPALFACLPFQDRIAVYPVFLPA